MLYDVTFIKDIGIRMFLDYQLTLMSSSMVSSDGDGNQLTKTPPLLLLLLLVLTPSLLYSFIPPRAKVTLFQLVPSHIIEVVYRIAISPLHFIYIIGTFYILQASSHVLVRKTPWCVLYVYVSQTILSSRSPCFDLQRERER